MEGNIKIGKVWDIPIGLHFSWFLIFVLFTWSLAMGFFPEEYPELSTAAYWVLGLITSILFFGSVLVHELGHAYVALRYNIPVQHISLFIFGGVAQLTQEARSPRAEFQIAIAGPLASAALALLFGGLYLLDQHISYLAAPSLWLARINLLLALFNLIPGFPLDGGRLLRAIIWWRTNNLYRATQIASVTGQVFAFGFIALGLYVMFYYSFFDGFWLLLIGWFLQNAAAASLAHTGMKQSLEGVKVSQAMNRNLPRVAGLAPLSQVIEEKMMSNGQRHFFVGDSTTEQPEGMLTFDKVLTIPQRKRRFMTARQAMTPLAHLPNVQPDTLLAEAMELMSEQALEQLPVVENGQIVGLLSREQVAHFLKMRAEFGLDKNDMPTPTPIPRQPAD